MDYNEETSLPDKSLPKTYPRSEYVTPGGIMGDQETPCVKPQKPTENRIEITDHQEISILDIHEAPITGDNSPKTPMSLLIELGKPNTNYPEEEYLEEPENDIFKSCNVSHYTSDFQMTPAKPRYTASKFKNDCGIPIYFSGGTGHVSGMGESEGDSAYRDREINRDFDEIPEYDPTNPQNFPKHMQNYSRPRCNSVKIELDSPKPNMLLQKVPDIKIKQGKSPRTMAQKKWAIVRAAKHFIS
jgi:hypothetical protein